MRGCFKQLEGDLHSLAALCTDTRTRTHTHTLLFQPRFQTGGPQVLSNGASHEQHPACRLRNILGRSMSSLTRVAIRMAALRSRTDPQKGSLKMEQEWSVTHSHRHTQKNARGFICVIGQRNPERGRKNPALILLSLGRCGQRHTRSSPGTPEKSKRTVGDGTEPPNLKGTCGS